jgi:NTE family protein
LKSDPAAAPQGLARAGAGTTARVGLVLTAGGTLGYAFHAGVLAALREVTGWEPRTAEVIVGTSAGSLVAALLRAGFAGGDLAARILGEPMSREGRTLAGRLGPAVTLPPRPPDGRRRGMASTELVRRALLRPGSVRLGALAAAILPPGHVSGEPVVAGVRRLYGSAWPEAATWICAVSLDSGKRVVFGREDAPRATVAEAVAASCAIPAFFEPVTVAGQRHVDGGAYSVSNADLAAGLGLDLVLVSSPMSGSLQTVRGSLDLPIRAASSARLARETATVRRGGTEVIVFEPALADPREMGLNAMDSRRRHAVTRQAIASTRQRLQGGGLGQRLRAQLARGRR